MPTYDDLPGWELRGEPPPHDAQFERERERLRELRRIAALGSQGLRLPRHWPSRETCHGAAGAARPGGRGRELGVTRAAIAERDTSPAACHDMAMRCDHDWGRRERGQPLHCVGCGVLWPGHALPVPPARHQGYGALAQLPSWRSRVRAMVGELREG